MRVITDGPLAAVGSAMPVKIAKGIIAAYPAPFRRPGPLGVPGPLLHLEANVDGVKSDAPRLVNSVHTLDSLRFSSSHSSSLFVFPSLSQPGPSYPLSSSFCFSCPASSPSDTFSPIQGFALGSYRRSINLASGVLYLIFPVRRQPVSMMGFQRMSSQFSICQWMTSLMGL